MNPDDKSWLKDLKVSDASGGYLDRLNGLGNVQARQFLGNLGPSKASKATPIRNQPSAKREIPSQNNLNIAEIDDKTWLEERKKRFPRKNCDMKKTGHDASGPLNAQELAPDSKPKLCNESSLKVQQKSPTKPIKTKRLSLFEKLMGDDIDKEFD